MAKTVSSLSSLEKEISRRINVALNGDIQDSVEKCFEKHIHTDVLSAYSPKVYERRGESGIEGKENIQSTVRDRTLTVKNVAKLEGPRIEGFKASKASSTEFSKLLEGQGKGVANIWGSPSSAGYLKPRRFVSNTKEEISNPGSKVHQEIIKAIKDQFPER